MPTLEQQEQYWSRWNAQQRTAEDLPEESRRQGDIVRAWLMGLERTDLRILEVGCGTAWLTPTLTAFGKTTATDIAQGLLAKAQVRFPRIEFVVGDFGKLEFADRFDVIVALEVLSHVADQPAFVAKAARLLKPGGQFMLATQNRPVLERYNHVLPPDPGQHRKWFDRDELHDLLEAHFDVRELFAVTPKSNRGLMRIAASRKVHAALGVLFGTKPRDFLERHGFGWTLMARAQKRVAAA
jgi:2-polyprenyl-3-methyl-5-hydroxy-6-metoxy-1,4-benzoquinol methylase